MDTSAEKYASDDNRTEPFVNVLKTVRGFFRRMIGFFMLSEEDQLKAGIHVGGEGRDD